jgi:hypothetical protein
MSALSLIALNEMDENETRWYQLEQTNPIINRVINEVHIANTCLTEERIMKLDSTESNLIARWFSVHYHCLYVPPFRESQKKAANDYVPLGWALRFKGAFMAQPEYYDTLINLYNRLNMRIPSWRDDPVIAIIIIGEDNGFSD